MRKILIGTRNSPLAIAQAEIIKKSIEFKYNLKTELVKFKTQGDKNISNIVTNVKGMFTFELEQALINHEIDLAVHSLKDIPVNNNKDLPIIALSKRADPRDAIILNKNVKGIIIGTSSLRRKFQIERLIPEAKVDFIRGNINTRLKKLDEMNYFSGIILAVCGLERLGLENRISKIFSIDEIVPAPGQGIIACQGRINENYFYLEKINDVNSNLCSKAERSFSFALGAGCNAPVGAYAFIENKKLILKGIFIDDKSGNFYKKSLYGDLNDAEDIGKKLAEEIMKCKK